jgi:protein TonB
MKTLDKNTEKKPGSPFKTRKGVKEHMLVEDPRKHHLLNVNANGNTNPLIDSLIKAKEERVAKGKELHVTLSSFSLCLSLALIIGMFELPFKDNGSLVNLSSARSSFETLIEIPPTEQKAPPPPKLQSPKIIEVSDDELLNDVDIDLDIEITEDTKIAEVNFSDVGLAPPEEEKADDIFTIVDEKPEPAGGYSSFYDYVSRNLHYPNKARLLGIEGRVFIQFVVEKDGSLTDIQVVKGVGGGCDEEAVRVISQAPKWNPGKQRGRPVRVRMILPVVFKLLS